MATLPGGREEKMEGETRKTVLHAWHAAHGANMAIFASYDMPLWYPAGARAEHLAVLSRAGLFDTSHMAVITVSGRSARSLLQRCFSKDLDACLGPGRAPIAAGRCVYGVFLDIRGHVIDDAIVYQVTEDLYMVVVNAGMGGTIAAHLAANRQGEDPAITDLTDKVGKMDIQGPASARILRGLLQDPEAVLPGMGYFSFKGWFDGKEAGIAPVTLLDGTSVLVSRTGYTGEFGFELYMDIARMVPVWETLLEAGRAFDLIPCGLAARDSLRAGAGLPLSHQDIGHWPFVHNPWLFALAWDKDGKGFSKDFIGAEALLQCREHRYTLPFAGFDPRKINACEDSWVTDMQGIRIGSILTCTTDMAIGRAEGDIISIATAEAAGKKDFAPRGLSCGFVRVEMSLAAGETIILTDGKRRITVEIREEIRPGRTARRAMARML
ncbi:MAG: aminomethyltransferase family protein [Desulfocapsaceae bacterium]|nr:aminomethyltransferase family protein [Desulfocapsaceae bacterium]